MLIILLVSNVYATSAKQKHFASPISIAFDSNDRNVYVANSASNSISVIHEGKVIDTIALEWSPLALAFDSVNNHIYVANAGNNSVTVINAESKTMVKTIMLPVLYGHGTEMYPYMPIGLVFDSKNGDIYVTAFREGWDSVHYDGSIFVIDGATKEIIKTIDVGERPGAIGFSSKKDYIYVAIQARYIPDSFVIVIDGATNTVVKEIYNRMPYETHAYPKSIAVDSHNREVFVANWLAGNVRVINGTTNTIIKSIPVESPIALAYDPKNGYVYVATDASNNITVIDGATNEKIGEIAADSLSYALTSNSRNGKVYVANYDSNSVSIIDGMTNTVTKTIY